METRGVASQFAFRTKGYMSTAYIMWTKGLHTQSREAMLWALPTKVRRRRTATTLLSCRICRAISRSSASRAAVIVASTPSGITEKVAPIQSIVGPNWPFLIARLIPNPGALPQPHRPKA